MKSEIHVKVWLCFNKVLSGIIFKFPIVTDSLSPSPFFCFSLWSSQGGKELLRQLEIPENITTGSLYPEQYKSLFEIMEQTNEFDQSWLYDEDSLEDSRGINF